MSIISRSQEAVALAEHTGQRTAGDLTREAIDGVMTDLSDVLAQDNFVGDPETALVHHFGEDVFTDDELAKPYQDLIARINAQEKGLVPVLIDSADIDEVGNSLRRRTSLSIIHNGDLTFSSSRVRREDVKMHGFSDATAAVTDSKLAIVRNPKSDRVVSAMDLECSAQFDDSLLRPGDSQLPKYPSVESSEELVLRETTIADDGHGVGMPSAYYFTNTYDEVLQAERTPQVLVGWEEIQEALLRRITGGGGEQEAFRIDGYFVRAHDSGLVSLAPSMPEKAPHLSEVLAAVRSVRNTISRFTET